MPKIEVHHDEERELHELGAEIDGTWVAFATVADSDVTARAEALATHEQNNPTPPAES